MVWTLVFVQTRDCVCFLRTEKKDLLGLCLFLVMDILFLYEIYSKQNPFFCLRFLINCRSQWTMPNQSDLSLSSHSHCVVMWEEKTNNQVYAVVDLKRAKTVSTLKIGISIVFEGYQRERRRRKILFLGKIVVQCWSKFYLSWSDRMKIYPVTLTVPSSG